MTDMIRITPFEGDEIPAKMLDILNLVRAEIEAGNLCTLIVTVGSANEEDGEINFQTKSVVDFRFTRELVDYLYSFTENIPVEPDDEPSRDSD